MITELLLTSGKIAALAGASLGLVLIIYRNIIRQNIFAVLTRKQSFQILWLIITSSFVLSISGLLIAAFIKKEDAEVEMYKISSGQSRANTAIPSEDRNNKEQLSNFPEKAPHFPATYNAPDWVIRINSREYARSDDYRILREIGIRNNDQLTYKVICMLSSCTPANTSSNRDRLPSGR